VVVVQRDFGVEKMTEAETTTTTEAPAVDNGLRWYVVHAYSGMEKAVERNLQERIAREGMQAKFGRILVPTEEVVEMKNGQRKTTERKFYPGYVLVEMLMDDDTWHLVKHTNKVTGFVGGAKNRPAPISDRDFQNIMSQMQEGTEKPRHKVEFVVGEYVRVKEGPFTDFNGSVEEVNYEKNKVRVSVTIFGRSTPVELEFAQVEKT
jgi:transcription termination/antitermination protein NusG